MLVAKLIMTDFILEVAENPPIRQNRFSTTNLSYTVWGTDYLGNYVTARDFQVLLLRYIFPNGICVE